MSDVADTAMTASAADRPTARSADGLIGCEAARTREGKRRREDRNAAESIVLRVLPWLSLLLALAGFLWWCSSLLVVQRDASHTLDNAQPVEAWDNVPLPIIALLIVAGYALAILAMLYLPPMLGPEASIWALLVALVFLMTWQCWSYLLLEFVLLVQGLPVNCFAVLAAACCLLPAMHIFGGNGLVEDPTAFDSPKLGKVKSLEKLVLEEPVLEKLAAAEQLGSGCCKDAATLSSSSKPTSDSSSEEGLPVYLHIYDITHDGKFEKFNSFLAPRLCPLKLGGLFHAGVEVNGREWSFGYSYLGTGVCGIEPKTHPSHNFRETISLPRTRLSEQKILGIIKEMSTEYQGSDYKLFHQNCLHFADDFCQRLGVGGVPLWVDRLARYGEWICDCILRISQILQSTGGPESQCAKAARI